MFFNNVSQNVQVDKLEKLEPLKAGKLLSRLGSLQKQCGELCDLEKPVVGREDEFMGRVKAKVIKFNVHLFLTINDNFPRINFKGGDFYFHPQKNKSSIA